MLRRIFISEWLWAISIGMLLVSFIPLPDSLHEVLVPVAAAMLVTQVAVWSTVDASKAIRETRKIILEASDSVRPIVVQNVIRNLESLNDLSRSMQTEVGRVFDQKGDLEMVVRSLLRQYPRDSYIGTDCNVPSEFKKVYPGYLDYLFSSRKKTTIRILVCEEAMLRLDFMNQKVRCKEYVEQHIDHGALLLLVDPEAATKLAADNGAPYQVGCFTSEFIVVFNPEQIAGSCNVRMVQKSSNEYIRIRSCLVDLISSCRRVTLSNESLRIDPLSSDDVRNIRNMHEMLRQAR